MNQAYSGELVLLDTESRRIVLDAVAKGMLASGTLEVEYDGSDPEEGLFSGTITVDAEEEGGAYEGIATLHYRENEKVTTAFVRLPRIVGDEREVTFSGTWRDDVNSYEVVLDLRPHEARGH